MHQRDGLLVHDLDLLVDHPAGKPVDRYVHPVMLLPLHNKFVRLANASRIRRIASSLRNYIDQESPSSCLRRVAQGACDRFLRLLGTADRSTNGGCKAGKILPTNGLAAIITSWLRTSRIRNQRGSGGRRAGGNTSSWWWPNWQRPSQKGSDDCTVPSVDIYRAGTQRVWKAVSSRVISCVVRKEIQQGSLAAA